MYLHEKAFSSSSSSPRPSSNTGIPEVKKSKREKQEKVKCESFGCPLIPPELTQGIRGDIVASASSDTQQGRTAEFKYGNQHMVGLTQQGKDHPINQDRGIIVSPFRATDAKSNDNKGSNSNHNNDFLIGIFDGHGTSGHVISQYLQDNFAKRLSEKMARILPLTDEDNQTESQSSDTDAAIVKALKETFVEMDHEVPPDAANDGGSTASVIYRVGSKLFFANAGDSLSFLALHNKKTSSSSSLSVGRAGTGAGAGAGTTTKIVHKNRYDKAHLPEEKERIERLGGHIMIPPAHPFMSRVNAFYPNAKDVMSLAMSRSIGDWPHGKIGVIPDPIVDVVSLDELYEKELSSTLPSKEDMELFVVSSSDGLYDHRRPQFVADHIATSLFGENSDNLATQCMNIIDLATPKGPLRYRDDITLMALRVLMK